MKTIFLFLLLSPILAQAQTRVTTNEISTTTAWDFPATAPVTLSSMTVSGDSLFRTATTTTTFAGYIDIGIVVVSSVTNAGPTSITATCPAGKYVLTGSCYATDGDIRQCGPTTLTTPTWPWKDWKVQTTATGYKEVHVVCARIK